PVGARALRVRAPNLAPSSENTTRTPPTRAPKPVNSTSSFRDMRRGFLVVAANWRFDRQSEGICRACPVLQSPPPPRGWKRVSPAAPFWQPAWRCSNPAKLTLYCAYSKALPWRSHFVGRSKQGLKRGPVSVGRHVGLGTRRCRFLP